MGRVRDTHTHHVEHFYQVIWKRNNNLFSYSLDRDGQAGARTQVRTYT